MGKACFIGIGLRTGYGKLLVIRYGVNKQRTASDCDLRYRYLRMQGKATMSDFEHLDSIFISHRNPKAIQQLEQKVGDYEQAVQRQAELQLQQERIRQEQGELKKQLRYYQHL